MLKTESLKFHRCMLCEKITSKTTSILSKKTKSRILVFFKRLVNQYITFVLEHYSFTHFPFQHYIVCIFRCSIPKKNLKTIRFLNSVNFVIFKIIQNYHNIILKDMPRTLIKNVT